ncbi:Myelin-associated glycoprotein [Takifugu flavidus]|uniref:Myelin-associated glycoprotein n=1 Tax=Takifugu flavidus TaxID=433684 RepID=A0A5C6PHU9_9TELE|nr:Myelin-associated glycoprotein [Takifugu flavidus]
MGNSASSAFIPPAPRRVFWTRQEEDIIQLEDMLTNCDEDFWIITVKKLSMKKLHLPQGIQYINLAAQQGLNGSCVVIPCSFDFPDSKNDLKFTGMWKDGSDQLIYHSVKSKIMQTYWNRTELLGNLAHKNCSLKIDPLKDSDGGPFHFRVEIDKLDKFSYKDNKVSILMISEPDPISLSIKGQVRKDRSTSAVCFVTHSCPTSPPVFTWSHAGSQKVQHTPVKDGQWKAISTLRFQATKEDNNKHLRCRVTYKGGQQQEAASLLEVIFAPEISNTSHCTSGAKLTTCVCIAESSSPSRVQFVLSGRILDSTDMKTHDRVTIGILRVQQGPYEFIHCLANSTAGRANLTLSVIHLHKKCRGKKTGLTEMEDRVS